MAQTDFTIADVLAWARTKPADETYFYSDAGNCAVAQFGKATGRDCLVGLGPFDLIAISADLEEAVNPGARFSHLLGETFGALVKRLEALCPETPVTKSDWLAIDAYLAAIEQVDA